MDWKRMLDQMDDRGYTLQQIADQCGFASKGALHDLKSGKSATCSYERGMKLVEFHKKAMRRKVKA